MLKFDLNQIRETITLVIGDDGMKADEVVECLKKDYCDYLEMQVDTIIQQQIDRKRGK
jgi:2-oxoglutarate dehydrogenase complex dehydrogenase (E1) component-like enzyme